MLTFSGEPSGQMFDKSARTKRSPASSTHRSLKMHPRRLTERPRDLYSGFRLLHCLLTALFRVVVFLLLAPLPALAAGNVVQYGYDAAGNVVSIQRLPGPLLSITGFSPASGSVGDSVTISGTGFSATPGSNTVTFNGVAATVSSSTATSISTTVPSSATTGRIRVAVSGINATSASDFVVTTPGAPTITSFTPTSGASGTSVSATGTNFSTSVTTIKLNGVTATGSASSTTALSFTVPGAAASGRITATTASGTGSSTTDFIVPPPGLALTDIGTSLRISAGNGNSHVSVGTGSKSALVLFDGTANTYYSLQFASFGTSPTTAITTYKIVKPDNTVWVSGSISMTTTKTIRLAALPATGTYTLVLSPGNATLDTQVRLEADPVLTIDSASAPLTQDYPWQNSRFVFTASAGQRVGAGALSLGFAPSSTGSMTFQITATDGTILASQGGCSGPNCDTEFVASTTGTYLLLVNSATNLYTTGSVQISSPASGTLTADTAQNVTLSRIGQDAAYTFSVSSGDSYGIDLSGFALTPSGNSVAAAVFNPSGTQIASTAATPPSLVFMELGSLTTAGTYLVTLDPALGSSGTFKLTAKRGTVLQTTDSFTAYSTTAASEVGRFRFAAPGSQDLTIGMTGLAYSTGSGFSAMWVNSSSGSNIASVNCFVGSNCRIVLTAPAVGNYSVLMRPPAGAIISAGSIGISVPVTGTFVIGDPAQTVAITRPGQSARYTFSGTSAQTLRLNWSSVTVGSGSISVSVLKPDGSTLSTGSFTNGANSGMDIASLPTTGTYTVVFDSSSAQTMSASIALVTR